MTPDIFQPQPRARKTDPATSHEAAAKFRGKACRSHYVAIMGTLWKPRIPPEIAALTGLTVVQIDRRRRELLDRGAIRLTGGEREGYQEWAKV
jgi:hypothetical protein